MSEVTIGEHRFIIGKMVPRTQLHVARRLGPLLASLLDGADVAVSQTDGASDATKRAPGLGGLPLGPITAAFATMSDKDVDYILDACLDVVRLEQHNTAVRIVAFGGRMQFDWIDMRMMVRLASEVIRSDLSGFMPGAGSGSTDPTPA